MLSGWHGHAAPFAFEADYRAADEVRRFAVGTPPILSMTALGASLDLWQKVDIRSVRAKSVALTELFIALTEPLGLDLATRATRRDAAARSASATSTAIRSCGP